MIGASFWTLAYWVAFAAIVIYGVAKFDQELQRRRRIRRLRQRRLWQDSLEPKRWTR